MRAALPREGGIADQHDKRKQPSEIRRPTSQRGVKPGKNSCLGSRCAITFSRRDRELGSAACGHNKSNRVSASVAASCPGTSADMLPFQIKGGQHAK
jgi:hypothetical protein